MKTHRRCALAAVALSAIAWNSPALAVASDDGRLMLDGCVFDLMALNPTAGALLQLSDLKNRMLWSSDTSFEWLWRSACTDQETLEAYGEPKPLTVTNLSVSSGMYPFHVTNAYSCLRFPQSMKTVVSEDLATTNAFTFPNCVVSERPVETGRDMTLFAKFRWGGNLPHPTVKSYVSLIAENARSSGGFALGVYTIDPTKPNENGYLAFSVAGDAFRYFNCEISFRTNQWMTVAVVVKALENGGSRVTAYAPDQSGDSPLFQQCDYEISARQIAYPESAEAWQNRLVLGASASIHGNHGNSSKWLAFGDFGQFRGDIAKLQVYDRALSQEEVYLLLADSPGTGGGFRIGSANACADEFSAADGATRAEVFEPRRMSPDRLLKGLDAANPSVTIRFPLPASEIGLPKVLLIDALPKDVGASAPVEIWCNDSLAATLNMCRTNCYAAFLRKRAVQTDDSGNMTLRIVRRDAQMGTVLFDSIEFAGSWRAGLPDGKCDADVFAPCTTLAHPKAVGYQVLGGGGGSAYLMNQLYGLREDKSVSYYPATRIAFRVPSEVASSCASQIRLSLVGGASDVKAVSMWVNGVERLNQKGLANDQLLTVNLAPGELNPGANALVISNAACDFAAVPDSSDYPYALVPDCLSFEFCPPPSAGTLLIVR